MDEYEAWLSDAIIGDERPVTYRLLSRTLKVHVQLAKEMLYAFYTAQSSKKPGSIHATYLLTGYRRPAASKTPGADEMEIDSFDASTQASASSAGANSGSIKSIVVVPEEKLKETKEKFTRISSIHIYSLEPAVLSDLTLLSAVGHDVITNYIPTELSEMSKTYGAISNPVSKRRGKPLIALPPEPVPGPARERELRVKDEKPHVKQEIKTEKASSQPIRTTSTSRPAAPPKKTSQKDFFANWNSANQKAKENKAGSKTSSRAATPPPKEVAIKMDTDSEGEDEEPAPARRDHAEDARKRKAKQEELEAMMDIDDEPPPPPKIKAESPPPKPSPEPSPEPAPAASATGRQRKRRKVKKRVHVKDAAGYLIARDEWVWEDYSEDEPEPASKKPVPATKTAAKGKPAKGQGSLMNFFQKRP